MFKDFEIYKLAVQKMLDDNYLIFDTETTGLSKDDEIIELGIVDCRGEILYDGLFRPEKEIHWSATKASGLTNKMLENEPLFKDEFDKIMTILNGRPVIAFNEPFDERLFFQTAARYSLDQSKVENAFTHTFCCQHLYSKYIDLNGHAKLEYACDTEGVDMVQNHRATGDCLMTLALLEKIAEPVRTPDLDRYIQVKAEKSGIAVESTSKHSEHKSRSSSGHTSEAASSYLALFNENKSLEEIAELRGVRLSTVENHIIDLYLKGDIKSINFMISEEYVPEILRVSKSDSWDGRLRSIKAQLPDECSYGCIQATLARDQKEGPRASKPSLASMINSAESKIASAVVQDPTNMVIRPER